MKDLRKAPFAHQVTTCASMLRAGESALRANDFATAGNWLGRLETAGALGAATAAHILAESIAAARRGQLRRAA